ncbi:hypothetical protein ABWL39_15105 [Chitinivorax sp. PXF-14]|uniref:hypothetical protein n=1 Tax=Chitinivorax sp. PXF-14 TaxID=3230488 RepID=UPI003467A50D
MNITPSLYSWIFYFTITLTLLVFLRRKTIDPLLTGFIASLIYFLPGLVGYISFSYGVGAGSYQAALAPGALVCMSIVVSTLAITTIAYDRLLPIRGTTLRISTPYLTQALAIMMLVGFIASLLTIGKGYLCTEKSALLARVNPWYYLATYSAPLCFVSALSTKSRAIAALSLLLIFADLFVGFRGSASVTLIALCLMQGSWFYQGWKKRIIYLSYILFCGVSLFLVKQLAWNIKYTVSIDCPAISAPSNESGVLPKTNTPSIEKSLPPLQVRGEQVTYTANLLTHKETYTAAFSNSEPMVVQATLNETINRDFKLPAENLVNQLLSGVPGGKSLFGLDVSDTKSFNDFFQKEFFPKATFGMANNPWAQAFSVGRFSMVFIFSVAYAFGLSFLTWLFSNLSGPLRACIAVIVGWWGLYLHRNDVLIEIGILKMVIYIIAVSWLLGLAINTIGKSVLPRIRFQGYNS